VRHSIAKSYPQLPALRSGQIDKYIVLPYSSHRSLYVNTFIRRFAMYSEWDFEPHKIKTGKMGRPCFFSNTCVYFHKVPPLPHKPLTRRETLDNLHNEFTAFGRKLADINIICQKSTGFSDWTCCQTHREMKIVRDSLQLRAEMFFVSENNPHNPLTEEWFAYEYLHT